jgi:hypothetical protein
MDSATQITMLKDGVSAAIYAPNEARAKVGLAPKTGGDSPMIQQQNFSLAALAERDANDPFSKPAAPPPADPAANDNAEAAQQAAKMIAAIAKGLA